MSMTKQLQLIPEVLFWQDAGYIIKKRGAILAGG
jgi:hypothetical protein